MNQLVSVFLTLIIFNVATANPKTTIESDLNPLTEKINANEFKQINSVVVSQNNQIKYEHHFNGSDAQSQHNMRSASKSITSLAIGLAIDEGKIKNVQQPVLPYFKDKLPLQNPDARKQQITIEDLLTMSSLLECDDWNNASRGNEEKMYIIEDWTQFMLDLPIRGTAPWRKTPAKSKYGRAAYYCTGGVQVLADMVERATGQKMSDYLQEKLFNPLKIKMPEHSFTPLGVTNGGGGMGLTSRDWIKIGQMMMAGGQYNDQRILSQSWVDQSLKRLTVIDENRLTEYGYLWWIFDFKVDDETVTAYAAAGNGGNYLFMIPELNAQVVITSSAYNTNYAHPQSQQILTDYVIPALQKHETKRH